jgi:hypothetical protein
MHSRADCQIRAISLAKECWDFGARSRTIHHVTGLRPREVVRLFLVDPQDTPRGRPPASPEWYYNATLACRIEASAFCCMYRRLRECDFGPSESLVGAYRVYHGIYHASARITFDRAFDLASHLDARWLAKLPSFTLVPCPTCEARYLDAVGSQSITSGNCPFCKAMARYPLREREVRSEVEPARW